MKHWLIFTVLLVGCAPLEQSSPEQHPCSPASRDVDACIALYDPACGWFSEDIRCVRYPCAATYSNICHACSDEKVAYWTPGECPA
ncbi:MAG TPA: hypothetical protein VJC16_02705 [Candidatus Nanoarchaeia archaeon]|nr:hypothetical protein [Candidatus Nanoarchaeia archaeon]